MLSIHRTDFIALWAYEERISAHAQPAVKCEQFLHVQSMLSIRGTNFIAHWAYAEPISSHAEPARTCLKVEYLGWIEYDFQKSRVTDPWDHMVSVSAKKVKKKFMLVYLYREEKGSHYGCVRWPDVRGGGVGGTSFYARQKARTHLLLLVSSRKLWDQRSEKSYTHVYLSPLRRKISTFTRNVVLYIQARSSLSNYSILVERRAAEKAWTSYLKHGQKTK
jgi:hypothetical protein